MDHSLAYKKALLILATDGVDKHLAMCYLDIDKQLDECIQKASLESTKKLCIVKCEMKTLRDYQSHD